MGLDMEQGRREQYVEYTESMPIHTELYDPVKKSFQWLVRPEVDGRTADERLN